MESKSTIIMYIKMYACSHALPCACLSVLNVGQDLEVVTPSEVHTIKCIYIPNMNHSHTLASKHIYSHLNIDRD